MMTEMAAGTAQYDITPRVARLAGQFHKREADGGLDRLWLRSTVLESAGTKFAFVVADLLDVTTDVSTEIRNQIADKYEVPFSNSIVSATHTHTAPEYHGVRRDHYHQQELNERHYDRFEDRHNPYDRFLVEKAVQVVGLADRARVPAELLLGTARAEGISFNRILQRRALGTTDFTRHEHDLSKWPVNPEVNLMFIKDLRVNQIIGGTVIFGCHPDSIGGNMLSADYPFFLHQHLRSALGNEFIPTFAQGPGGDINHVSPEMQGKPYKGREFANPLGSAIGRAVVAELGNLVTVTNPDFAAVSHQLRVPLQDYETNRVKEAQAKFGLLENEGGNFDEKIWAVKTVDLDRLRRQYGSQLPLEVQAFRFDRSSAMVTLPGEVYTALGQDIQARSPFKRTFVISLANDRPSYFPTEAAYDEGDYGEAVSRVQKGSGEMLADGAVIALEKLAA